MLIHPVHFYQKLEHNYQRNTMGAKSSTPRGRSDSPVSYGAINQPINDPVTFPVDEKNDRSFNQPTSPSLPSLDWSNSNEYSYEPLTMSDFTIHFLSSNHPINQSNHLAYSFHVHSLIMYRSSEVMKVIIDSMSMQTKHSPTDQLVCTLDEHADTIHAKLSPNLQSCQATNLSECNITSSCSSPNHRCISLPSCLGGRQITVSEMRTFINHLYSIDDSSGRWLSHLAAGDLLTVQSSRSESSWLVQVTHPPRDIDDLVRRGVKVPRSLVFDDTGRAVKQQAVKVRYLGFPGHDKWVPLSACSPAYSKPLATCNKWLDDCVFFHIANYLNCDTLLSRYRECVEGAAINAQARCNRAILWKALELADRYNWRVARLLTTQALSTSNQNMHDQLWQAHFDGLSDSTKSELLRMMSYHSVG